MSTITYGTPDLARDAQPRAVLGPVLLATHGRAPTDAAPVAARLIAEHLAARIEVVAVVPPLPAFVLVAEAPILPPDFDPSRRTDLRARVERRVEPVLGAQERWAVHVREGQPGIAITDAARELGAGLIVLGTGSHRAVDRVFGEEVSLQVVRRAGVPVLAVAPDAQGPFTRAVVGMDFSAASVRAARVALALLDPPPGGEAVLTLLHVRPPLDDAPSHLASWSGEYDATASTLFARTREMLRAYLPPNVRVDTQVRGGVIVDALRDAAADVGAQLVAVGTHGPGWVERLLVGSVATSAVRRLTTSVLVAPPPPAAERARLELRVRGHVTLPESGDWGGTLDTLTRRNFGRRVRLEVTHTGSAGFAVEADRYRFVGATYDPHDHRLDVMLGDPADRTHHLTHGIGHVRSVEIVAQDDRRDRTLLVEDADGQTALTFLD